MVEKGDGVERFNGFRKLRIAVETVHFRNK